MAELGTRREAPSFWAWFAGTLFVGTVGAAIGIASWRRSKGPLREPDMLPTGEPEPALELPGLPPPGSKTAAYPGPSSPTHAGTYTQLPITGPGYVAKRPQNAWGTPATIGSIQSALQRWGELAPDYGADLYTITISDISRKGGGKLAPHLSHHQGRDVDINFSKTAGEPRAAKLPTLPLIPLLVAFLQDDNTKAIFLDWDRQRDVWEALEINPDLPFAEALRAELQYPLAKGTGRTRVRHFDGHARHIHVRYRA